MLENVLKEIERAISQIHFATLDMRSLEYGELNLLRQDAEIENKAQTLIKALKEEAEIIESFIAN